MTERSPQKLQQLKLMLDRGRPESGSPYGLSPERAQKWILHFNIEHVHGPEEVDYAPDELVVVCNVRDGRPYVKSFVEHYTSMGVKHIFFLDNGSTDGTVEALKEYDNVSVLRTTLPYKRYDYAMKQHLIERFGKKGRWCLCADIDELFDYPYSDVVGLDSFLGYLNSHSYTAVAAQMLDMFPKEPLSEAASEEDEPLKERHRFYDVSNIGRKSFKELRRRFPSNVLESDEIEAFRGGIRETVFGVNSDLTKFPLVFSDGRIKPMDDSSHWVDNARIADLTCVLFHYKFLDGYLREQAVQAVKEEQYHNASHVYKKYLQILEGNPTLRVKGESAREIESVNDLVENGFLVVSEDYMELVYDEEEEKRKKSADRAALRGEPGEGEPEDEAAFRRARARAEAQRLRAKRLERRLEDLREQNRREVAKLSSTLARVRKKNRNLTHQLRSMRASRSWRLISKLGGIRARVLNRKR